MCHKTQLALMNNTATQVGLKTTIVIECEDESEIISHLKRICTQIRHHNLTNGPIADGKTIDLSDSNCYGEHTVKIEPQLE